MEIDRLQTTCRTLNYHAKLTEDYKTEMSILIDRLKENEELLVLKEKEVNSLMQEKDKYR